MVALIGSSPTRAWGPSDADCRSDSQAQSSRERTASGFVRAGGRGTAQYLYRLIWVHLSAPFPRFPFEVLFIRHKASCQMCNPGFERCLLLLARSSSFWHHQPWLRIPNPGFWSHLFRQLFMSPLLPSLPEGQTSSGRRNEKAWFTLGDQGGFLYQLQEAVIHLLVVSLPDVQIRISQTRQHLGVLSVNLEDTLCCFPLGSELILSRTVFRAGGKRAPRGKVSVFFSFSSKPYTC